MANKKYSKKIILETAFEMSKEIGVNALSMRMLAKELGCSVMPIYDAFESKDHLVESLRSYCVSETMDELNSNTIFERYSKMVEYGFKYPKFFLDFTLLSSKYPIDPEVVEKLFALLRKDVRLKDLDRDTIHRYNMEVELFIIGMVFVAQDRKYDEKFTNHYKNVVNELADDIFSRNIT